MANMLGMTVTLGNFGKNRIDYSNLIG